MSPPGSLLVQPNPADGSPSRGVNIQGNGIYIGILQEAGTRERNWFVYTEFNGSGNYVKLSARPVSGTRYQFRIWKTSGNHIGYRIALADGTSVWSSTSTRTWPSGLNYAWWGYESANSKSQGGIEDGAPAADVTGLYSLAGSSTLIAKNNVGTTLRCVVPPGSAACNERVGMFGQNQGSILRVWGISTN